jgi:hypothetical protein
MNRILFLICFLISIQFLCCNGTDNISVVPSIKYLGISKSELRQSSVNIDSLWLQISFEDGDGDIGFTHPDDRPEIVVIDGRTNNEQDRFNIPDLPESENKVLKGTIAIRIYTTCCLFNNGAAPCDSPPSVPFDSIQYHIYLIDRAGHQSNVVTSEFVRLRCI